LLTVLMASCNGAGTLPAVLQAYTRLRRPPGGWRLIIADNGSTDATAQVIAAFRARLPLQHLLLAQPGKNAALNQAVALALQAGSDGADLFVFSDDDALPRADWLLRLHSCAQSQPGHALFGGAIVPAWRQAPAAWLLALAPQGLTWGVTDAARPDGPVYPGLVWGANMAVRQSIFAQGWRFDESIGPRGASYAMGSEVSFNLQLAQAGHLAWFCRAAVVAHIIQPAHVQPAWVLRRAWLFGRGQCRQQSAESLSSVDAPPACLGVPRWMLARLLRETVSAVAAWLRRDREALFLRRWELAYLHGFLYEAWRGRRKRQQRVLISSYSGELGGMELRMAQEAQILNASGYRSTLALRRFPGLAAWRERLSGEGLAVKIYQPPLFIEHWAWRRCNLLRAMVTGGWQLRRLRPDLLHVAFCWTTYGASLVWLAQRCRLPVVISVHNAFPAEPLSHWQQRLLAQAFPAVKGVYAVSPSALRHFLAIYQPLLAPDTPLAVIPNGVDTERFIVSASRRLQAREKLGLPPDALVLGSVARLSAQKRPLALLALFLRLQPQFPRLYLVLAGSGPLEPLLRAQVMAAGMQERVIFAGFQAQVELLMPAFDLHLLLSRSEGFGIATIEAMACGVPALGTDVPGTADILSASEGGLLLPLDDEQAACDMVAALLHDAPRRSRMALAARSEAEQRYGMARLASQLRQFYAALASVA